MSTQRATHTHRIVSTLELPLGVIKQALRAALGISKRGARILLRSGHYGVAVLVRMHQRTLRLLVRTVGLLGDLYAVCVGACVCAQTQACSRVQE